MFNTAINFWAVLVGSILSYFTGFLWFTIIFRNAYIDGLGKTAEELAKGPSVLTASIYQLLGNLLMGYVLALLMVRTGMQTVSQAIILAILVWLGFVVAFLGPTYAFQAYSFKFFVIVAGGVLVSFIIMGTLLGVWK